MVINGFQLIWWRRPVFGWRVLRLSETELALAYRWSLCLGWLEIRRWR